MKSLKKYRVLKKYPKLISNSGRMVFLEKGRKVYLKPERHVKLLVDLGYLKEIKDKKIAKVKTQEVKPKKSKKSSKKKIIKKEEIKINSEEPLGDSEDKLIQE